MNKNLKQKNRESLISSEASAAGADSNLERRSPVSPIHPPILEDREPYLDSSMIRPDLEMAGSTPDPTGFTPELTGIPAPTHPAELSPNPERLAINNAHRVSRSSDIGSSGAGSPVSSQPDGSFMRSNLNVPQTGNNRREDPHVMSWMEYDASPKT